MPTKRTSQDAAKQALQEIQRYLADEIAPLMAVDAARKMLRLPAKFGAAAIEHWLEAQLSAPDRAANVSGYLYHAIKKFHHFSEVKLIDPRAMNCYIADLSRIVVRLCPEREQAELRLRLSRIGEVKTTLSSAVSVLNREVESEPQEERIRQAEEQRKQEKSEAGPARGPVPVSARLSTLVGRLKELRGNERHDADKAMTQEVLASFVTKAANEAGDTEQLEASLEEIRGVGIEPKLGELFRMLGQRLPGWEVQPDPGKAGADATLNRLLKAMHQIVALAGSSEEGVERFSAMVYAAIEQFNEGHLAQAVAMLDVADRLIDEKKVDSHVSGLVRTRSEGSVSLAAMRQFSSVPAKHGLLRKVLGFFPAFAPDSLLSRLDGEPKRDIRKLMLSLLEVHGSPCRPCIMERLNSYLSTERPDPEGFYSRNLVFLLRRIPRRPEDDIQQELELFAAFSHPERPFLVAKEAISGLAQLGLPETERILVERLAAYESEALREDSAFDPEELLILLDRACAALARVGTNDSVRALLGHARRKEPALGETLGRLQHLAGCDLTRHNGLLPELLEMLKKMLPAKLLGLVLGRRVREVSWVVRALSGTNDPRVQRLFEEIVERFPEQEFAQQAREALACGRSGAVRETEADQALSGDLEVFGLPTLLQSMADSKLSGRLVISETNGRDRSVISLAAGTIQSCEMGRLRGLDAVCQLLERPQPGTFRFEKGAVAGGPQEGNGTLEVTVTILEAMRRHDEFQEDRALVPDGSKLMAAGAPPSVPADEQDRELAHAIWCEAAKGTAPESCENVVAVDAYRVRRLYAHWLEKGALKYRPAA